MKKRNLFLSLMCSIILTIALVAVTIVGVVVPKNNSNNGPATPSTSVSNRYTPSSGASDNEGRDGSEENPYLIYDAQSFIDLLKEHGAYVEGEEGKYFELTNNINFEGVNFVTLFGQGTSFGGHIDGKGFSVDNITIHVTVDNINEFVYLTKNEDTNKLVYVANVGFLGNTLEAEIKNLDFAGLTINVDDEVYPYVASAEFANNNGHAFRQLTIGSVVATAIDTNIEEVNVNATINASAYSIYADGVVAGYNAVGGLVGVLSDSNISLSKAVVTVNAEDVYTSNYFIGGIAGYAYDSTIEAINAELTVNAGYDQRLYIGGVMGYAIATDVVAKEVEEELVENNVVLKVAETKAIDAQKLYELIDKNQVTLVAGIVVTVVADDMNDACTIADVNVKADVNMNCYYAGAVYEIQSAAYDPEAPNYSVKEYFVTIKDIISDSNVNVLKAYGLGKDIIFANVDLSKSESVGSITDGYEYNIRITGSVVNFVSFVDSIDVFNRYVNVTSANGGKDIKIALSSNFFSKINGVDTIRYTITLI